MAKLSEVVAGSFYDVHNDIKNKRHIEYVLHGGRGSAKSSFIAIELLLLLKKNPNLHAVVCRKVKDTLRDSVYAQIAWAIDILGLELEFKAKTSPLEITYIPTGQKIYFRGADDPAKLKSIKAPFGYIGILWFEELDQFSGPEEVRNIEQSVIRGGDKAYIFKSFNPPKTANNWANEYVKIPKQSRLTHHSTYLGVPQEWLGSTFINEAEFLKDINPEAYEHEYLGIANGAGGLVFDNVTLRAITDDEILYFDRIYRGFDWGWYPDPTVYEAMHFQPNERRLFLFDEFCGNKLTNADIHEKLKKHGVKYTDRITAESAGEGPKTIADFRSMGYNIRRALKGAGSREYSFKWLQSLKEIVIDPLRCPLAANEFIKYEYEKDKDGNVISGYPDGDDHAIDAVRYAMETVWKRRGQ